MSAFSERLREIRTSRKIKQTEVAEYVGVTVRAYQFYEHGTQEPTLSKLIALADFFNVSLDYLCGRGGEYDE